MYAQQAGLGFFGFMLTIDREPFDNKALRQAVAFAINRDEIVTAIYEGNREPANGPIPPTLAWAVDPAYKPYSYDPAKAKAKLIEGGKPDGFSFKATIASNSTNQQLAELIQAQLSKVGIDMKIEAVSADLLQTRWKSRESTASLVSFSSGGNPDPDNPVSSLFLTGGGLNFFPYNNSQVEELIQKARRTSNVDDRAKAYKQMVPLIMEDSPYIFLTYTIDRYTGNKKVGNWYNGYKLTSGYGEFFLKS